WVADGNENYRALMDKITVDFFKKSVVSGEIPGDLSPALQALWHDARGDWQKAHDLIDHLHDPVSSHVHAYLHRKEGDIWNADYWYTRAKRSRPAHSLDDEWESLVSAYL